MHEELNKELSDIDRKISNYSNEAIHNSLNENARVENLINYNESNKEIRLIIRL